MHDIKSICKNPSLFAKHMQRRKTDVDVAKIVEMDQQRRKIIQEMQTAQSERKKLSEKIFSAKNKKENANTDKLKKQVIQHKELIEDAKSKINDLEKNIIFIINILPNIAMEDVPCGVDEADNKIIKKLGDNTQIFSHSSASKMIYKSHFELGADMGLMDFTTASKLSGSRFVILEGGLAKLERAISNFMLDIHTSEFGYREISPPILVNEAAMFGSAHLPKFANDLFKTGDLWLIPTGEVPLTNLVREQIIPQSDLPLRYTALTPCFRREAGAAGKDTRGMLRQHQFYKVELVSITHPDESAKELERMVICAEEILKRLLLPWQRVLLCDGDMGFSAQKTYDLEVWLPSEQKYREISSCSSCGNFQARRLNARYSGSAGEVKDYVHTLNGSGLASGRTLIAVMENYQQPDGSIVIPFALRSYMQNAQIIDKKGKLIKV